MLRTIHALRSRRTVRFLVVGAYNTVFAYVVFVGLYYWLGQRVHYDIVLVLAYIVSVTNSYLMQRRFVFASQSRRMAEFLRFNVVNLLGMGVNMALLTLAVSYLTPNVALAQAAALVATTALIYLGHSLYSFRIASQDK